jgi:hypothetical protein
MTNPLHVDHEELIQLADGHMVLVDELLGGAEPQIRVEGEWPSAAAAQAVLGATRMSKATMATRLGGTADGLRTSADGYKKQDGESGVKLGELAQLIGCVIQPIAQVVGQMTSAGAQMLSAAEGAVTTPLSGVIGAVSSAGMNHSDHKTDTGASGGLLGPHPGETDPPLHEPNRIQQHPLREHSR